MIGRLRQVFSRIRSIRQEKHIFIALALHFFRFYGNMVQIPPPK